MVDILKDKHILIADDDARNTYALSSYLEATGLDMKVHTAFNGQEAIGLLDQRDDIDIVLMDMMMPDMDGYEAIRQIRSNSKTPHIPIIAVTAQAMKGDREKCLQAGASGYVSKPVDMQVLLTTMTQALNTDIKA
jgi:CheY-like chemotaxis protein